MTPAPHALGGLALQCGTNDALANRTPFSKERKICFWFPVFPDSTPHCRESRLQVSSVYDLPRNRLRSVGSSKRRTTGTPPARLLGSSRIPCKLVKVSGAMSVDGWAWAIGLDQAFFHCLCVRIHGDFTILGEQAPFWEPRNNDLLKTSFSAPKRPFGKKMQTSVETPCSVVNKSGHPRNRTTYTVRTCNQELRYCSI
ncbi:hypothetical protein B0T24DRAFT_162853 [Lasiosphaeria ovina]|uniref:Uncharacterized protein n=1 Tax=Lasiosphaeria ovina TaxID=92902 RepID=A0AAE0NDP9_9PEZI|nr:hypothetical protein B0T24DRAFT_162853 [Lasiosphaeria ovina]